MTRPIIERVDHIVIEAEDEQAVFDFFTKTLGLPEAWPMAQWGPIHEGGVNLGNCNIGCNHKLDPNAPPEPRIAAVAFEPHGSLDSAIAELDARGIAHSDRFASGEIADAPEPWSRGWTNVMLLRPPPFSFLCEYHHDTNARRATEKAVFDAHPNPLGILGVEGVWCNTTEFELWDQFLPDPKTGGPWIACDDSIGAGVDLDYWWGLYLRVGSVTAAATAAESLGIHVQIGYRDGHPEVVTLQNEPFTIEVVDRPMWK